MKTEGIEVQVDDFGNPTYLSLSVSLNRDVVETWLKRFQDLLKIKDFDSLSLKFVPSLTGSKKLEVKTIINYFEGEDHDGPQAA